MKKLTETFTAQIGKRLLPVWLIQLIVYSAWLILVSLDWSGRFYSLLCHLLLIAVFVMSAALVFYAFFQIWKLFADCFYSARAYLIRTLPYSRKTIYWSWLVTSLLTLLLLIALFTAMVALPFVLHDFAEIQTGGILDVVAGQMVLAFVIEVIVQWIAYMLSGAFGIAYGHRNGRSEWLIFIATGIACALIVQLTAAGLLFVFEPGFISLLDSPTIQGADLVRIIYKMALAFLLLDGILAFLCARRVEKHADVE